MKKLLINRRNRLSFLVVVAGLATLLAMVGSILYPPGESSVSGQSKADFPELKFAQSVVYGSATTSELTISYEHSRNFETDWYLASNPLNSPCPNKEHLEKESNKVASQVDKKEVTIASGINNYNQAARYCILVVPVASVVDINHRIEAYQVSIPTIALDQSNNQVTVESRIGNSKVSHPQHGSMHKYYWSNTALTGACDANDSNFATHGNYYSLTTNPATITAPQTAGTQYLCVRGEYNNSSGTIYIFKAQQFDLNAPNLSLNRESSGNQGRANDVIVATTASLVSDWHYIYGPNITSCDQNSFGNHVVNSQNPNNGKGTSHKFNIVAANPAVLVNSKICFKAKNSSSVWGYSSFADSTIIPATSNQLIDVVVEQTTHSTSGVVDGTNLTITKSNLTTGNIAYSFHVSKTDVNCSTSTVVYQANNLAFQGKIKSAWPSITDGSYVCIKAYADGSGDPAYFKIKPDLAGPVLSISKTSSQTPTTITVTSTTADIQANSFQYQYLKTGEQLLTSTSDCNQQITNWKAGNSVNQPQTIPSNVKIICFRARDKIGNYTYLSQQISQIRATDGSSPAPGDLTISVNRNNNIISYNTNRPETTSWYYVLVTHNDKNLCLNSSNWSSGKIGYNNNYGNYCIRAISNNLTEYALFQNYNPNGQTPTTGPVSISISRVNKAVYLRTNPQTQVSVWKSVGPFASTITDSDCAAKDYQGAGLTNQINESNQAGWYCYRATLTNGQNLYKAYFNHYSSLEKPNISVSQDGNRVVYTSDNTIKQWRYAGPFTTQPGDCQQIQANNIGQIEYLTSENNTGWYCFMATDYRDMFQKPQRAVYLNFNPSLVNEKPRLVFSQDESTITVVATNKSGNLNWEYHFSTVEACNSNRDRLTVSAGKLTVASPSNLVDKYLCVKAVDANQNATELIVFKIVKTIDIEFSKIDRNLLTAKVTTNKTVASSHWQYKLVRDVNDCSDLTNNWGSTQINSSTLKIDLANAKDGDSVCVRVAINNQSNWRANHYLVSETTRPVQPQDPPQIVINQADNQLVGSTTDGSLANWKVLAYEKEPTHCNDGNAYFDSDLVIEGNLVQLTTQSVGRYYCFKASNDFGTNYRYHQVTEIEAAPTRQQPNQTPKKTTPKKKVEETKPKEDQKDQQDKTDKEDEADQPADEDKTDKSQTDSSDNETDDPTDNEDGGGLLSRENLIWWIIAAGGAIILGIILIEIISSFGRKEDSDEDDDQTKNGSGPKAEEIKTDKK